LADLRTSSEPIPRDGYITIQPATDARLAAQGLYRVRLHHDLVLSRWDIKGLLEYFEEIGYPGAVADISEWLEANPSTNCERCAVALDKSDSCPKCGVYHGEPCDVCGHRGYHRADCPEIEG
jgi:hypothetical protein